MHTERKPKTAQPVPLSVVYLLLLPAACFGFVLIRPTSADALDHFGGFLGGYSALVGSVLVAVKGVQEWAEYKRRKAHEKASEVAGQAIVATIRFGEALPWLTTFFSLKIDPEHAEGQNYSNRLGQTFEARLAQLQDEVNAYRDASHQAEAYLPDDAVVEMRKLWKIYDNITQGWRQFILFAKGSGAHDPNLAHEGQQAVHAAEKEIGPTIERIKTVLRKYTIGGSDDGT